jgi:hypothetical protein
MGETKKLILCLSKTEYQRRLARLQERPANTPDEAAAREAALQKPDSETKRTLRGDAVIALRWHKDRRALRGRKYFLEVDKAGAVPPWRGAPKTYVACHGRKSLRDKVYAERLAVLHAFYGPELPEK